MQTVGDKSISHRVLILSALQSGVSHLEGLSTGKDVESTIRCLGALGVRIDGEGSSRVVHGTGQLTAPKNDELDCGNSGTTMRLLMGVLAAQPFESALVGDGSLSRRPMGRVAEPLRAMGARILLGSGDVAPARIFPSELRDLSYQLPVASSQVKSALLLAGHIAGKKVVLSGRTDSRDHTERLLGYFQGARDFRVPGDVSAASFYIAQALLEGRSIEFSDIGLNPTRLGFIHVLKRAGARVQMHLTESQPEPRGMLWVKPGKLRAFEIEPEEVPFLIDEIPILALLATQAHGRTRIQGASELRFKESDRLEKTAEILTILGATVRVHEEGFEIDGPSQLRRAPVETYGDHRLAMMASVAGCAIPDPSEVAISDPDFFSNLGAS
jgi:3-phosphoshikimate 1-carboxyvinyltransferase